MSDLAIRVEELGKLYHIGAAKERYPTLRESIIKAVNAPLQRLLNPKSSLNGSDTIWALKDISFEVKKGEVVGIIGRNGAGKSTLLKILSHITEPTKGRVRLHGRVGCLLEVGTGFHPELTGRENIFMNGAILGMKRTEINRKFDEIVEFAEIEKFLDTPVKRYSSGMYVRLAFAVAAHLETEILVIDEVLAVGDSEFQKKCLGKIGDISNEGRTVLFVSHNMQSIKSLCKTAFLLNEGLIIKTGDVQTIVKDYLSSFNSTTSEISWPEEVAPGNSEFRLISIRITSEDDKPQYQVSSNKDINIDFSFKTHTQNRALCIGFDLLTSDGITVLRSYQTDQCFDQWPEIKLGMNHWRCIIPGKLLNAGEYYICPRIGIHNLYWIVKQDAVVKLNVVLNHGISPLWNSLQVGNRPGVIAPIITWSSR